MYEKRQRHQVSHCLNTEGGHCTFPFSHSGRTSVGFFCVGRNFTNPVVTFTEALTPKGGLPQLQISWPPAIPITKGQTDRCIKRGSDGQTLTVLILDMHCLKPALLFRDVCLLFSCSMHVLRLEFVCYVNGIKIINNLHFSNCVWRVFVLASLFCVS